MGKRIELETIYRPSKRVVMKRLLPLVRVTPELLVEAQKPKKLAYGTAEHYFHKRATKAAQMRRYRAKKAGK